jgi:hypothetical protein
VAVSAGTPYITPETLRNASTGIAWGTIPRKDAAPEEKAAEQLNICQRASGTADGICHQVLRATLDTEEHPGPGSTRVNIQRTTGNALITVYRWPVLQVTGIQIADAACWPLTWESVPAGQFRPASSSPGVYGTSAPSSAGEGKSQILVAPGWIRADRGRNRYLVQPSYVNGWPHAGTAGDSNAGDEELAVDDCTGWAPVTAGGQGALGTIQDGFTQETITCTAASAFTGPGILTLASSLAYGHGPGVVVTTLPPQAQEAMILLCVVQALERGATATTHQQVPGSQVSSGVSDQVSAAEMAAAKLHPFTRII